MSDIEKFYCTDSKVETVKKLNNLVENGTGGGGLEIGDVAFTQMAIDETKGKRRKLNGQIIIQEQYQELTNILKASIAQNPDMACTEQEWQAEITMSIAGICYKFVVDDEGGTIRLPKYPDYFIGGITTPSGNVPVVGNGNTLGVTDGTNLYAFGEAAVGTTPAFRPRVYTNTLGITGTAADPGGKTMGVTTDPDKSGLIAKLGQASKEQIKGTYFIQVATGSETEDNIINEIELNNPFFFGMSQFFEVEPNNISWLKSVGQWNSKAVYTDYYNWILTNVNNNKKGFVTNKMYGYAENNGAIFMLTTPTPQIGQPVYGYGTNIYLGVVEALVENGFVSTYHDGQNQYHTSTVYRNSQYDQTGIIDDYHWCIDTVNETFRLPLKTKLASGKAVVGNGIGIGITDGTNFATLRENSNNILDSGSYGSVVGSASLTDDPLTNNKVLGITTDPTKSGLETSDSNLYLYFYVGETVQNANLVNVGRIEEKLSYCLTRNNKQEIISWGMPDYTAQIEFASKTDFNPPCKGVVYGYTHCANSGNQSGLKINGVMIQLNSAVTYNGFYAQVSPEDTVYVAHTSAATCYFAPMKGAN